MSGAPARAERRAVVGVDLGGTKCHGALADARGRVLEQVHRATGEAPDPVEVLLRVLRDLTRAGEQRGLEVTAYAVGIPAFVEPASGLVVGGLNVGWDGFDLRGRLDAELPAPVVIENDVNMAALGEARAGAGSGASSFVTMAVGTGLGGAVVVGGELVRGHHNAAGEVGFLMAGRHQLRRPGLLGMESVVGGLAIAERAREVLGAAVPDGGAAAVFALAERGDAAAAQLVDEVLDHLAMAVIDVVAVLDPERLVLDGSIGRALGPYLPRLRDLVAAAVLYPPDIRLSTLAPSAAVVGAVSEALRTAGLDGRASTEPRDLARAP